MVWPLAVMLQYSGPGCVDLAVWWLQALSKLAEVEGSDDDLFAAFVDPRLEGRHSREAMRLLIEVATHCVRLLGRNRPDMADVVRRLWEVKDRALGRPTAYPGHRSPMDIHEESAAVFGHVPLPQHWLEGSHESSTPGSGTVVSSVASFTVERKPGE